MYQQTLKKPDGRTLYIYSRRPIPQGLKAPSPNTEPLNVNPHLRWHPLLGQWVSYASHRQNRTFLPPPEYNPLAPMRSEDFPTELPSGDYDVAVFENLFPALYADAKTTDHSKGVYTEARPAQGSCEVVVFSQNSKTNLGELSLDHVDLLLQVWGDRYRVLSERDDIHYILPFENRGVEVGVTLHHPHGQIYSYPFIPPIQQQELSQQRKFFRETGHTLLSHMIAEEQKDGRRIIFESDHAIAFIPVCARYPYEVWVLPKHPVASVADLGPEPRRHFAKALKTIAMKYDTLWNRPFPYLMTLRQAPTDGVSYPEWHFHIQFYPALRSPGRLKYLAGTEIGAGMFANDSLPEEKAKELKEVVIPEFS